MKFYEIRISQKRPKLNQKNSANAEKSTIFSIIVDFSSFKPFLDNLVSLI